MDEVSERRLRKHGFSEEVIRIVAANPPHQHTRWVNVMCKFSPEEVEKTNWVNSDMEDP